MAQKYEKKTPPVQASKVSHERVFFRNIQQLRPPAGLLGVLARINQQESAEELESALKQSEKLKDDA